MRRSKDVTRTIQTVKQYAEEALEGLVPNRFASILVNAIQTVKSQVDLNIEVTQLSGQKQTILYFVKVEAKQWHIRSRHLTNYALTLFRKSKI